MVKLREGMVFAIEPMVNAQAGFAVLDDHWTASYRRRQLQRT